MKFSVHTAPRTTLQKLRPLFAGACNDPRLHCIVHADIAALRGPDELGSRELLRALPVRDQRLARQVDEQDDYEEREKR